MQPQTSKAPNSSMSNPQSSTPSNQLQHNLQTTRKIPSFQIPAAQHLLQCNPKALAPELNSQAVPQSSTPSSQLQHNLQTTPENPKLPKASSPNTCTRNPTIATGSKHLQRKLQASSQLTHLHPLKLNASSSSQSICASGKRRTKWKQRDYSPSLSICLSSLVLWKLISSSNCSNMVGGLAWPEDELPARVAMPKRASWASSWS